MFAARLKKARETFGLTIREISEQTTLSPSDMEAYENANMDPKGDHVLILADFFRCDYRYFVDPAWPDTLQNTTFLFRAFSKDLNKQDRLAIQETLHLCENEAFLQNELATPVSWFEFSAQGNYFKAHGQNAAMQLRLFLGHKENELKLNVFDDLRRIGFHVFRRRLCNKKISGLFVHHPTAGKCIIVNYDEDMFRQRFTGAHEAGHAILDTEATFNLSFEWEGHDLKEVRANAFASFLLIPPDFARKLPNPQNWNESEIIGWASKMMLSTHALAIGLKEHGLIDMAQFDRIKAARIPRENKSDPELSAALSVAGRAAKVHAMEAGLSAYYVGLALDAYERGIISHGRLREMLMCSESELVPTAEQFGRTLKNVH